MGNPEDSKVGVIIAASRGPLGLFALIVLAAQAGLVTTVTFLDQNPAAQMALIVGIILIFVLMVLLVGTRVLGKTIEVKEKFPGHGEMLGTNAVEGWFEGDASSLDGVWEVRWYGLNASGEREPYRVKGPDGDEIEYPPEQAKITTKDAMISVENTDKTTRYVYFLEGRLSSKNIATLTYWSQPRIKESALTGVLLMTLKDDYHRGTTMEGMMIGYDRKGMVFRGETEWRKIARNVPAA